MKLVYGQTVIHAIPTCDEWKEKTKLGRMTSRSTALKRVDTALTNFDTNPGQATYNTLCIQFNTWYQSKVVNGKFTSGRGDGPDKLKNILRLFGRKVNDRQLLMAAVERKVQETGWQTKATWGEIYETQKKDNYGLLKDHVEDLEWEARVSSGWAMNTPDNVEDWADKGSDEIKRLRAWPNLAAGRAGLSSRMRMMPDLGAGSHEWPRFNIFVRKGVFCHSSAAIAAHILHTKRTLFNSTAHFCPIESIDIIQQSPAANAGMCHWWVCVNRPDEIRMSNRTIRITTFDDYVRYLPLVGGFVVDMWGAMFQPANQFTAWSYQPALASPAVIGIPEVGFLGPTTPT